MEIILVLVLGYYVWSYCLTKLLCQYSSEKIKIILHSIKPSFSTLLRSMIQLIRFLSHWWICNSSTP